MKATFWGTRGSLASPGPQTVRYGGNTACVEVRDSAGGVIILDAGTGIRQLGATLGDEQSIHLFLSPSISIISRGSASSRRSFVPMLRSTSGDRHHCALTLPRASAATSLHHCFRSG
jgi:hypothetical protein